MKRLLWHITAVAAVALVAARPVAGAAEIVPQGDDWHVAAKTYRAVVDGQGNVRSLEVDGAEFLATKEVKGRRKVGGAFPGDAPAASVRREGDRLTAARGDVEVTYAFDDEGFTLTSVGGAVRWYLSDAVTAFVARGGVIPLKGAAGDVYKVVVGETAVRLEEPHHIHYGRLFPSRLTRGGKPEERFTCRWTCGVPVRPAELIDLALLRAAGKDPKQTAGYAPGDTPRMALTLKNLAVRDASATVRWSVRDHPHDGEQVLETAADVTVAAGKEQVVSLQVPVKRPGLYWVHARLFGGGEEPLQQATRGFIYDADGYKPPLTRPHDFGAFWNEKLTAMRRIPFEPKRTGNAAYAIDGYKGYDLEITGHDGQRLACVLVVPDGPGPHDAEVGGYRDDPERVRSQLKKFAGQPVGVGMWQRGARRIHVAAALPGESTYRRWNGRDDNNMLHSYLRMVRLADYLRSRDDVRHIWLFGASRTGASVLAAAALAPEQVAAVNVHVPTCCGISWQERPYRGWGRPPSRTAEGLKTAAYFDPVNFAPDLTVPVVMDGGFYDGLAPSPGILAFHNHATTAPFRRCAIEQGRHGYFAASHREEMEAALADHLARRGIVPGKAGEKGSGDGG